MEKSSTVILKLLNNGRHAIIETTQFDELNPKPYLVRKVVEIRKEPAVFINGEYLDVQSIEDSKQKDLAHKRGYRGSLKRT